MEQEIDDLILQPVKATLVVLSTISLINLKTTLGEHELRLRLWSFAGLIECREFVYVLLNVPVPSPRNGSMKKKWPTAPATKAWEKKNKKIWEKFRSDAATLAKALLIEEHQKFWQNWQIKLVLAPQKYKEKSREFLFAVFVQ